jgi:transposase-like protein
MGRPKGGKNRQYSKEEKLGIVKEVMAGKSVLEAARESGICDSVVRRWVKTYAEQGEEGLTPKRKPGNPLAMYSNRKELSEVEQLRYELAAAQLEIARLKKAQYDEWRDVRGKK